MSSFTCLDAYALAWGPFGRSIARQRAVAPATPDDVQAAMVAQLWMVFAGRTASSGQWCPQPAACPAVSPRRQGAPCEVTSFTLAGRPIGDPRRFVKRMLVNAAVREQGKGVQYRGRTAPLAGRGGDTGDWAENVADEAAGPEELVAADAGLRDLRARYERLRARVAAGEPLDEIVEGIGPRIKAEDVERLFEALDEVFARAERGEHIATHEVIRDSDEHFRDTSSSASTARKRVNRAHHRLRLILRHLLDTT